jgi:hypothetical protein
MKLLYPLALLLLLIKPAFADSALTFKTYHNDIESTLTYYIKDQKLRLFEENSPRINIYDKASQIFSSRDKETGKTSRIDSAILAHQIELLNKKRMIKLSEVEKQLREKLGSMDDKEREIAESLINQLKYPEFYGAHTFIKIIKTSLSKTISNINCDVYNIKRGDTLLKQACIASSDTLKLGDDFSTLDDFYRFNYSTQTRLMLATGKTDFTNVDYHQENIDGIPIEVITKSEKEDRLEIILHSVSTKPLEAALFESAKPQKVN